MDERFRHKIRNYKIIEENIWGKLHDIVINSDLSNMTSKAQATKMQISGQPQKDKRENTQIYAIRNQRRKVTTNTRI